MAEGAAGAAAGAAGRSAAIVLFRGRVIRREEGAAVLADLEFTALEFMALEFMALEFAGAR
jgi:hypothetical protein